jgi:hypothetical protein
MALDAEEVALRARERITERGEADAGFSLARLMSFINDARQGLVDLLASENDGEYVYTKTFAGNAANGVLDLSPFLAADEPLILDALMAPTPQARVYIDGYPYQLKIGPDRGWLSLDPSKVPTCAVEDQSLFVKGKDGKVGTFAAGVKLSAAYVPSLANIRANDVRKLIDVLVTIALASTKQMKRPAPKPATAAA